MLGVSCMDVVHGPWHKWRKAEDHRPGSIPASCDSFLESAQVRHPCCPSLLGTDSEVRDSSLVQSADLSQDPEQVMRGRTR